MDNQAKHKARISEKARKDKKQRVYQPKWDHDHQENSISTSKTNTTPTKKKAGQNQDFSKVIYYRCNKKRHYSRESTEPKN